MALITLFRATPGTLEPLAETVNLCKGFFDGVFRMVAISKKKQSLLTADEVRRLLSYNENTGELRWKVRMSHRVKAGDVAGTVNYKGKKSYRAVGINGVQHSAHRLIWLLVKNEWPEYEIDHENGNGIDNRWSNLKCATTVENCRNRRRYSSNTSGATGVYWRKNRKRWVAYIWIDGNNKPLGHFKEKEEAIAARKNAERELGYHKNHGTDRPL